MTYNYIPTTVLFILGAQTTAQTSINNEFVQLGFLGLLLSILIWYSRSSYRENIKREATAEKDKQALIDRYEAALKEHDQRYHELHKEIMALLKMKIDAK